MTKPIKATTEECLKHFVESHPKINNPDTKDFRARNTISQLLGVNTATGYEWFGKFSLPVGPRLLRLRYFLELNGYQPLERQYSSDTLREFSNQVALQAIQLADAAEYIGTTIDVLVDVVMCRQGTSSQREVKFEELVELHRDEAAAKLEIWQTTIESLGLCKPSVKTTVVSAHVTKMSNRQVIEALAHLILAARPIAELVLSEDFSADDRRRLRELTANGRSNAVFDLSNLLNRLCGERARKELD